MSIFAHDLMPFILPGYSCLGGLGHIFQTRSSLIFIRVLKNFRTVVTEISRILRGCTNLGGALKAPVCADGL